MSKQLFYHKLLSMLLSFAVLALTILATSIILLAYVFTGVYVFYVAYLGALIFVGEFAVKFYLQFRYLQNNPEYFVSEPKTDPFVIDNPTKSIQVCQFYRNGVSFPQIDQNMGFKRVRC